MIPTLQVVKIQTTQILAGSVLGKGSPYGGGDIQSRGAGFSGYDDEE